MYDTSRRRPQHTRNKESYGPSLTCIHINYTYMQMFDTKRQRCRSHCSKRAYWFRKEALRSAQCFNAGKNDTPTREKPVRRVVFLSLIAAARCRWKINRWRVARLARENALFACVPGFRIVSLCMRYMQMRSIRRDEPLITFEVMTDIYGVYMWEWLANSLFWTYDD